MLRRARLSATTAASAGVKSHGPSTKDKKPKNWRGGQNNTNKPDTSAALAPYVSTLIMMKEWHQLARDVSVCPNMARVVLTVMDRSKPATRLPLHEACRHQAPIEVVEALLCAYPEAVLARDSMYHFLPIHFACRYGECPAVVESLLQKFPTSRFAEDRYGQNPVALAHRSCSAEKERIVEILQSISVEDKACS